jgi:glycosyltransferase involved in cell wall biosynthesis
VIVHGPVTDPGRLRDLVCVGDVYVFPSRHEGFAVAPIEAAAAGLPVVAARASGIEDAFPHGEASGGVLVDTEDPSALAAALERLLDQPLLSAEIGHNARRHAVATFGTETIGRQLRAFLNLATDP